MPLPGPALVSKGSELACNLGGRALEERLVPRLHRIVTKGLGPPHAWHDGGYTGKRSLCGPKCVFLFAF